MKKSKAETTTPIKYTEQFLAANATVKDLRLHALLWFNAFEQTMRDILAWKLGCADEALPNGVTRNSSLLFDLTLAGHADLRNSAKKFAEARNSIAHRFHEGGYEEQLGRFCKVVLGEDWPNPEVEKLAFLSKAVQHLAIDIASTVSEAPPRGDVPFPQIFFELDDPQR